MGRSGFRVRRRLPGGRPDALLDRRRLTGNAYRIGRGRLADYSDMIDRGYADFA